MIVIVLNTLLLASFIYKLENILVMKQNYYKTGGILMNTLIGRFFTFIMKERIRKFIAFTYYVLFICIAVEINLPLALDIICFIIVTFITLFCIPVYQSEYIDKIYERNRGKIGKNIIPETKKIAKEILMFIPILIITTCITSFIMFGKPANQTSIDESFYKAPIYNYILIIIIGPIIEEWIFRFLPSKFINNRTLYIIVSTVIFATMHVIDDPNAFYYIWFYMMNALYYAYRYHKTKDILVPISMHSLNNLIATLLLIS